MYGILNDTNLILSIYAILVCISYFATVYENQKQNAEQKHSQPHKTNP